jgi:hypothetical protein
VHQSDAAVATAQTISLDDRKRPLPGVAVDATVAAMRRMATVIAVLRPHLEQPCPSCATRRWQIADGDTVLHLVCRHCGWTRSHIDDRADGADAATTTLRGDVRHGDHPLEPRVGPDQSPLRARPPVR